MHIYCLYVIGMIHFFAMKTVIIGTAGHIDHGKTKLVKALTGVDTDRLKQEKEKGISIELGFAPLRLENVLAGIVDVPGHERFIKTMVSGSAGVDIVLFCIAADEGIMPQTREHLQIIKLLHIQSIIFVITKSDLISYDQRKKLSKSVESELSESGFKNNRFIFTSVKNNTGIDELKEKINVLAVKTKSKRNDGYFRMPVDRIFSIKGFGTVVTGTSQRGSLKKGDKINIFSQNRGFKEIRVKGIESFDSKIDVSKGGMRLGINLGNIDKTNIEKGDILALGDCIPLKTFDAWVECVHSSKPIKHQADYRINIDSIELACRVSALSPGKEKDIYQGNGAFVRIALVEKAYIEFGQRFILRNPSPLVTAGGGILLFPDPPKSIRDRNEYIKNLEILRTGEIKNVIKVFLKRFMWKGLNKKDLFVLLDREFAQQEVSNALGELEKSQQIICLQDNHYLCFANYKALWEAVKVEIAGISKDNPLKNGVNQAELAQRLNRKTSVTILENVLSHMIDKGIVLREGELLKLKNSESHLSVLEKENLGKIESQIEKGKLTPPTLKEMSGLLDFPEQRMDGYIKLLERKGKIVRVSRDMYYSTNIIKDLQNSLIRVIKEKKSINVSDFKKLSGASRKYSIPLLEYFDRVKITLRKADNTRIIGSAVKD